MLPKWFSCFILLLTASLSMSCNQRQGSNLKMVPVVPVKGEVTVDGIAEEGLKFQCFPLGDFPVPDKANSLRGIVKATGEFSIRLYEDREGIPPGQYALAFVWPPTVSLKKLSRGEELKQDRLKGKYGTKESPALKFTVEDGQPLELDQLNLATK